MTPKPGEKVDRHRLTQVGRAMKELGVQMIPTHSPQARGRSERNLETWQRRLSQELRLAGIAMVEAANNFLRERYIGEFDSKLALPTREKDLAFRKTSRADLHWIFSVQTERVVGRDNTVAIGDRHWQLKESRFRDSLAGSIHEHFNATISIRYGPHMSVASMPNRSQSNRRAVEKVARANRGNQKAVSNPSQRPLGILGGIPTMYEPRICCGSPNIRGAAGIFRVVTSEEDNLVTTEGVESAFAFQSLEQFGRPDASQPTFGRWKKCQVRSMEVRLYIVESSSFSSRARA